MGGTHQASNLTVVSGSPLKTGTQLETRDCEYGIAWNMILLESKIQKTILYIQLGQYAIRFKFAVKLINRRESWLQGWALV